MLPNIPCVRQRPLPARPQPTEPGNAGVLPASSPSAPTPPSRPQKIENRSDSGQFRSDFSSQRSTLNSQLPPPPDHQPSTINPQPLWFLQPDEPAADYQLFAAWLQLSAPRRLRKAAPALGCSVYRLRRLSARHNWKTRAAAFDQHRARATSAALDKLIHDETSNWKERVQRFRVMEWLLHEEMLEAAHQALHQFEKHPGRASFRDLLALYKLAFDLGRRACGLPLDPSASAATCSRPPSGYLGFEAALEKIYGQPLPAEEALNDLKQPAN